MPFRTSILTALILLISSISAFAQNAKADKLIKKGEDAYHNWLFATSKQHFTEAAGLTSSSPNSTQHLRSQYFLAMIASDHEDYDNTIIIIGNHIESVLNNFGEEHTLSADYMHALGRYYYGNGLYDSSIVYYEAAYEIRQKHLAASHLDLALVLGDIAASYDYSDRYNEAAAYYQKALDVYNLAYDNPHKNQGYHLNNLGLMLHYSKQNEKSIKAYEKSLQVNTALYGTNSSDVSLVHRNLSICHRDLKNWDKALEHAQLSFESLSNSKDPSALDLSQAKERVANIFSNANKLQEAVKTQQEALDLLPKGEKEERADMTENLGNMYYDGGDYNNALKYYQEALGLTQASKAAETALLSIKAKIAETHENLGDFDKALNMRKDVHKKLLAQLPQDNEALANSYMAQGRLADVQDSPELAMEHYMEALQIYLEDSSNYADRVAQAYNNIGTSLKTMEDFESALTYHNRALSIRQALASGYDHGVGQSFNNLSVLKYAMGKHQEALDFQLLALEHYKNVLDKNDPSIGKTYLNVGTYYGSIGDASIEALYLDSAASVYSVHYDENHPVFALLYKNKVENLMDLGLYREALKVGEKAVHLNQNLYGDTHTNTASAVFTLGNVYFDYGDMEKARDCYQQALTIFLEIKGTNSLLTADANNNIANTFSAERQFEKAAGFLSKSLYVYKNTYDEPHEDIGLALNNIAICEEQAYTYKQAKDLYEEALDLFMKLDTVNPELPIKTLINLAGLGTGAYTNTMKKEATANALSYLTRAEELANTKLPEGHVLQGQVAYALAGFYQSQEQSEKAQDYLLEAINHFEKLFGNRHPMVAFCYASLGFGRATLDDWPSCLEYSEKAIEANLKPGIKWKKDQKLKPESYYNFQVMIWAAGQAGASNLRLYKEYKQNKHLDAAKSYLAKAETIFDGFHATILSQADQVSLNLYKRALQQLGLSITMEEMGDNPSRAALDRCLHYSQLTKSSSLLAAMNAVPASKVAGIPDDLIKKEQALATRVRQFKIQIATLRNRKNELESRKLLELEKEASYWNEELSQLENTFRKEYPAYYALKYNFEVPSITDLQEKILTNYPNTVIVDYVLQDEEIVIFLITSKNILVEKSPYTSDEFIKSLTAIQKSVILKLDAFDTYSDKLYQLLWNPVEKMLSEAQETPQEIIITPGAVIDQLPFEYLRNNRTGTYLIEKYAFRYTPNLALLQGTNTLHPKKDTKKFLGFAPVFDPEHKVNRLVPGTENWKEQQESTTRATRLFTRDGTSLSTLLNTKKELESSSETLKRMNFVSDNFLFEEANEELIKSYPLKDYDIIHFATHGYLSRDFPSLTGLVMAQDPNSSEDCILFNGEILGLELDASLVTLSACETALGTFKVGEGTMGLTRGFFYAGTDNLLVSCWKVDDKSTALLMTEFYRHVVEGDSFSQALRKAKIDMITGGVYAKPYYWSPFILHSK